MTSAAMTSLALMIFFQIQSYRKFSTKKLIRAQMTRRDTAPGAFSQHGMLNPVAASRLADRELAVTMTLSPPYYNDKPVTDSEVGINVRMVGTAVEDHMLLECKILNLSKI